MWFDNHTHKRSFDWVTPARRFRWLMQPSGTTVATCGLSDKKQMSLQLYIDNNQLLIHLSWLSVHPHASDFTPGRPRRSKTGLESLVHFCDLRLKESNRERFLELLKLSGRFSYHEISSLR